MKKSVKILWRLFFVGAGLFILMVLLANWGVFGRMPSIEDLQNPSASLASQVYADDGTLMGKYYLEDRVNVEYRRRQYHHHANSQEPFYGRSQQQHHGPVNSKTKRVHYLNKTGKKLYKRRDHYHIPEYSTLQ